VDDLDAGLEDLRLGGLLGDGGRGAVHRHPARPGERTLAVNGLADDVEHPAEGLLADRNLNRRTGGADRITAPHAFGGVHRDGAYRAVAEALLHLEHELATALAVDLECVENLRQALAAELH